jgi:hypothetical protein
MNKPNYQELYRELETVGFFMDRNANVSINGFRIDHSFTFTMQPHKVYITCAIPGYNRSKGKTTSPSVRVVEFYPDGSAWIAQPGKLDDAIHAIETLIKQRKESKQ